MVLRSNRLKVYFFMALALALTAEIAPTRAEDIPSLPDDATNLTSGTYNEMLSQASPTKTHEGDVGVSGTANVNFFHENTNPTVPENYDSSYTLNGSLTVGSGEFPPEPQNGSVSISNHTAGKFDFKMNGNINVVNGGDLFVDNNMGGTMNFSGVSQLDVRNDESIAYFSDLTFEGLDSIIADDFGRLNFSDATINGADTLNAITVSNAAKLTLDNTTVTGNKINLNVLGSAVLEMKNGSNVTVSNGGSILFDRANLQMDGGSSLSVAAENPGEETREFTFVSSTVSLKGNSLIEKKNSGELIFDSGSIALGAIASDASKIVHSGKSGNINISYPYGVTLRGASQIVRGGVDAESGGIYISGTDINMKDSSSIEVATGNGILNISQSNLTMNGAAKLQATQNPNNAVTFDNSTVTLNDAAAINAKRLSLNGGRLEMNENSKVAATEVSAADGSSINLTENAALSGAVSLYNKSSMLIEGNSSISGSLKATGTGSGDYPVITAGTYGQVTAAQINGDVNLQNAIFNIVDGNTLTIGGSGHDFMVNDGSLLNLGTGKLDLNGNDLRLSGASTLGLRIASDSNYGQIINGGNVVIDYGAKLDVAVDRNVINKGETKQFQIFSGTSVNGADGLINQNRRYKFEHQSNGLYDVTQVADAADIALLDGGTENNAATAEAWLEGALFNRGSQAENVYERLDYLSQYGSDSSYSDALTALAPEVAPMVRSATTENSLQVFNAVQSRLEGGSSLRMTPGRAGRYARGMASGDMYREDAVWVQGLYNKSELEDTKKAKGYDAESYGGALGFDNYVTDSLKLGIGYAYTFTDVDGFMRQTDINSHTGFVYGEFKPNRWFMNAVASYSFARYDENKDVAGIGVKGRYDVNSFAAQVMTGYKFGYVTPELGVRYVTLDQDGYEDSIGQKAEGISTDVVTGVFGLKFKQDFFPNRGFSIRPELRVAATYDFVQDDLVSVVSVPNGSTYQVEGESLDKFGIEAGAGLTLDVGNRLEMAVNYEGKFRKDYTDHTGMVNMKFKF